MIYTADEKRRMDRIIEGFRAYIQAHPEFDILYSEKAGYIQIPVKDVDGEVIVGISSVDELLHVLFNEIINDVRFEDSRKQHFDNELDEEEEREARRRITAILETLDEEAAYCMRSMEEYLRAYPNTPDCD